MGEHVAGPNARSWEALKSELGFAEAEHEEINAGAQRLIAQARAFRLAEVRRSTPLSTGLRVRR
jgi:hypothetical protein